MAARATFKGLETYELSEVNVTDRELGHGSYASVIELEYMGLKCAGKKIHELLLKQGNDSYTVRRFEEECRLLSQVRHPNIVQFLGVHFQRGVQVPILVMEYLPTNLTSCINHHGILPKEISYSILHDVALGLRYLHSQTPPIIHRDLSSNNVLLTANMTAKISDLGVARILNLAPLQVSHMTQTPGTPAYMPPEAMVASPSYGTSIDVFSFGILMIHMFSGKWPEPQVGQIRTEHERVIPVSEAERREVFLQAMGNDHPLMELILQCIKNNPEFRAKATEIARRVSELVVRFPVTLINHMELMKNVEEQKKKVEQLTLAHSIEISHLKVQLKDLLLQNKIVSDEVALKSRALKEKESIVSSMSEQLTRATAALANKKQRMTAEISWSSCADLPQEGRNYVYAVSIDNNVYVTGDTTCDGLKYIVDCYDLKQDQWTQLPELSVSFFGLGRIDGILVTVGGLKMNRESGCLFTFEESEQTWQRFKFSMPTARSSASVLSLEKILLVAGGYIGHRLTDVVEIFKSDESQWYRTDPLPVPSTGISLAAIGNVCYGLGGWTTAHLNQTLSSSIDDLLTNAVRANQITRRGNRHTHSAWKKLADTPTYQPGATVLAGSLLAIGGWESSVDSEGSEKMAVSVYSPSTKSWIYVSDLPSPRTETRAVVLSPTEILVIGGYCGKDRVKSVFKGTLTIAS